MINSSSKLSKLAVLLALLIAGTLTPSTPASTQTAFWVPAATSCVAECKTFHSLGTNNAVVTDTYRGEGSAHGKELSVCAAWDENKKGFRAGVSTEGKKECAIAAGGTTYIVKRGYLCLCMDQQAQVPNALQHSFQLPWVQGRQDDTAQAVNCDTACSHNAHLACNPPEPCPVPNAVGTGTYRGGPDDGLKLWVCAAFDTNQQGFRAGVNTEGKNKCAIAAGGTTLKVTDYACLCTRNQVPH